MTPFEGPIYVLPNNIITHDYAEHSRAWREFEWQRRMSQHTAPAASAWPWQVVQTPTKTSSGTGRT